MQMLQTFWYSLRRSLTEPEYYYDILKAPFTFSLKYLYMLLVFILFIKALFFSISVATVFPKLPGYVSQAKSIMSELYPSELVITINNGSLRTNVDEPYKIPFPKSMNIHDGYLAVIDTKASVENIDKYNTVFFITKNAVAYPDKDSGSGYRVQPLSDIKGYTVINRLAYDRFTKAVIPYFDYAPVVVAGLILLVLILFPLIGSAFYLVIMLFYLLILTVLVLIMAWLLKKQFGYWSLYQLSMHGITFSLLFDMFKGFFNISIPFTFVMPYLIWMLIVFNSMSTKYAKHSSSRKSSK